MRHWIRVLWRTCKKNWSSVILVIYFTVMCYLLRDHSFAVAVCGFTVGAHLTNILLDMRMEDIRYEREKMLTEIHLSMLGKLRGTIDLIQSAITDLEWLHEQSHKECDPATCPTMSSTLPQLRELEEMLRNTKVEVTGS